MGLSWNDIVNPMSENTTKNVIAAFTEEQVERLTGVTVRQLRTWDRTKFFAPSLAYEDRSRPYARLYSFRDLACLKVLNALVNFKAQWTPCVDAMRAPLGKSSDIRALSATSL
jgi:hypothetical protein